MIELTLGAIAAALIAKALDRAEGKAVEQGEGVLRRLVETVRERFSGTHGPESTVILEQVEEVPDSKSRVEALARLLDQQADGDPEFQQKLSALVTEAQGAGVDVKSAMQIAYGPQSPQFFNTFGSSININYGGDPERPRRISD